MTGITINGKTSIYGIIGNPVSHSFSPDMQTHAFQSLGLNSVYLPFPTEEDNLPLLLDAFRITGVRGFNVTVPFKEKIIPYLNVLSKDAEILGSVNTVIFGSNGWKGYTTDGSGFIRSLKESRIDISGKKVLLIGAGGSAKAVSLSLAQNKVSSIHINNRTVEKAERLSGILLKENPNLNVEVNPDSNEKYDILINSTSVGMQDEECPVSEAVIRNCKRVIDIIYNPLTTPLLQIAIQNGIPCDNGIGMLLYQGVEAFEIWTGKKAPVILMKERLMKSFKST
ncbi:shikimate dehydrogenase [bacterium]|nr:shikimate dehydrogenase [bacterium]